MVEIWLKVRSWENGIMVGSLSWLGSIVSTQLVVAHPAPQF